MDARSRNPVGVLRSDWGVTVLNFSPTEPRRRHLNLSWWICATASCPGAQMLLQEAKVRSPASGTIAQPKRAMRRSLLVEFGAALDDRPPQSAWIPHHLILSDRSSHSASQVSMTPVPQLAAATFLIAPVHSGRGARPFSSQDGLSIILRQSCHNEEILGIGRSDTSSRPYCRCRMHRCTNAYGYCWCN